MNSPRIISCVNQKGGVGKTTCCANLASELSHRGFKVCVIDMDPQGHLSQHLGVMKKRKSGIYKVLQGESSIDDMCISIDNNLTLIPPGEKLIRLESVQMKAGRGLRLRNALTQMKTQPDFILIDCPPSNGFLVVNAIAASNELLLPVTPDYLGLSGLSEMTHQIKRYEKVMGEFNRLWVVISRYQKRKVSQEAETKIRHYFGRQVTGQVIFERAVLAECPGHGQPVSQYSPRSQSQHEFATLANEIIQGERDDSE